MQESRWIVITIVSMIIGCLSSVGCGKNADKGSDDPAKAPSVDISAKSIGPIASAVAPTLDKGWCGGHGVPESVCTRCDSSLIARFKEAGDWCAEHGLPESQCVTCNPAVENEWKKLKPEEQ